VSILLFNYLFIININVKSLGGQSVQDININISIVYKFSIMRRRKCTSLKKILKLFKWLLQ